MSCILDLWASGDSACHAHCPVGDQRALSASVDASSTGCPHYRTRSLHVLEYLSVCSAHLIIDTQVPVNPHFFCDQLVAHFWVAFSNSQVQINKSHGLQQLPLSVAFTIVEREDSEPISTQAHS